MFLRFVRFVGRYVHGDVVDAELRRRGAHQRGALRPQGRDGDRAVRAGQRGRGPDLVDVVGGAEAGMKEKFLF